MAGKRIEVDIGVVVPSAFAGLRKALNAVSAADGGALRERAATRPAEWNRLFPETFPEVADLSDLALSPSERRLHRESEQTFRVLNHGARSLLDGLAQSGTQLVVKGVGASDLVSVRGIMRAMEWARLEGLKDRFVLEGWELTPGRTSQMFGTRRERFLAELRRRMRVNADASTSQVAGAGAGSAAEQGVDPEGRYLARALDDSAPAEERVAAAVLALRACFFTTNYDGAFLAGETALDLVERAGDGWSPSAVIEAWERLDDGFTTPAIEIDRVSLADGSANSVRALLWRCIGVVHTFTGEFDDGMEAFERALERPVNGEIQAHMRMFRALCAIKRLGSAGAARGEIAQGLSALESVEGDQAKLHEGWLRNVLALTHFQEKALKTALDEEKRAIECVGSLHDASATHLKINLISNVSVLQESAKRFDDSIATWRKFEKISQNWGDNFRKHHRYRLAGLTLKQGNEPQAVEWYGDAYGSADQLLDDYHRQLIACELGRLYLENGEREAAADWYSKAESHATAIGDPLTIAQSRTGRSLARGEKTSSAVLELLEAGSTYEDAANKLAEAIKAGDEKGIVSELPKPRTKLNRPFDLVNLM